MNYLTEQDKQYIIENETKISAKELAVKFNKKVGAIHRVWRNKNEPRKSNWGKFINLDPAPIIETYCDEGLSKLETGKKHGVPEGVVTRILKQQNIPIRDLTDSHKKYDLNVDTFKEIDTQEKAYWLGFLYADGYVHKERGEVKLCLADKDYGHLVKYQKFLQSNIPIKSDKGPTKILHPSSRLTVCNRKFTDHLIDKGCTQAKSFTTVFPTWLKEELIPAFILGLMDGDGCVRVAQRRCAVQFLGTYKIVQPIHDYLLKHAIIKTPKRVMFDTQCPKIYTVNVYAIADIYALYDHLYSQCPVWLDRKKARFEEFFKMRESLDIEKAKRK